MRREDWIENLLQRAANLEHHGRMFEAQELLDKALQVERVYRRADEAKQRERTSTRA